MKKLVFITYDALGDWISANGMIRYLSESYDQVILRHWLEETTNFTSNMFRDNSKISMIIREIEHGMECDVVDVRYGDSFYPDKHIRGVYYNKDKKYTDQSFHITDNASGFYGHLGISPEIRLNYFNYIRDYDKENELYESLNLPEDYVVICEMENEMIDRNYIKKSNIVNLHKITDNFMHTLKLIENAKEVHLIENSISLFVYHMQYSKKMNQIPINLHAYARKELHRRCDSPDCNNFYLNMLRFPILENWNFIF